MWFDPYAKLAEIMAATPATSATPATNWAEGSGRVADVAVVATPPAPALDLWGERAGIIEWDAGLPRAEAEAKAAAEQGFASRAALLDAASLHWRRRLEAMAAAEETHRGRARIEAALAFVADGWAAKAAALDWDELALFGTCPRAPWDRLDLQVAAYAPFRVAVLTAEAITYASTGRRPLRHLRTAQKEGARLPWEGKP